MDYDISVDPAQLVSAAAWVETGPDMAEVQMRNEGGVLIVGQGDSRTAFARGDAEGGVPTRSCGCPALAHLDDDALAERECAGWRRIDVARTRLEPIVIERIRRRVAAHVADPIAIGLEPADDGRGWALHNDLAVVTEGGIIGAPHTLVDALHADEELGRLLLDFGQFVSGETEPHPYRLELNAAH